MQTTLNIGVETPFTFPVVSDIHLSEADERETEVPVENVEAYILACRDYTERYQ